MLRSGSEGPNSCANRCVRQLCQMTSQKMADGGRQRLALIIEIYTHLLKGTSWDGLQNGNCKLFELHIVNCVKITFHSLKAGTHQTIFERWSA